MSALSEAIARAEERLEKMTQEDREKYGLLVMQQELRRDEPEQPQ
jgi:hypothetical protein